MPTILLREEPRRLDGRVEIIDACLDGERAGYIHGGRHTCGKRVFVAAVQTSTLSQPYFIRMRPVARFTNETIQDWVRKSLTTTTHVV